MAKHEIVIVSAQDAPLSLEELCHVCRIDADFIQDLIAYDIIHPQARNAFGLTELQRIQTVLRLQRDLEVNLAGAAVVLDLLDELEELRAEMELVEKHYLKP